MLLANMSVARMVAAAFPDKAMLRRHPPPNERKIQDLSHLAEELVCSLAGAMFMLLSSAFTNYFCDMFFTLAEHKLYKPSCCPRHL